MELNHLKELVVIFGLAIAVLLICHRIKIPIIVGFLLTGILGGPGALGLINDVERVSTLAEIGIILLLFSIGMEFSIKNLMIYKRFFIIGGTLQVIFTSLAVTGLLSFFQLPLAESIFLGWLISLSSTAIVLKILDQTKQTDSPHGKMILGVLIFQDIMAVPMMLMTPLLTSSLSDIDYTFFFTMLKGIVLLFIVFISAERIVPAFLFQITKTGSRELFLLTVLSICFFVAWLAASVGLSLSLGAFLAGLILSESDYKNNALGDMLPFEEVFTSFFFISIGMLLNLTFFFNNLPLILGLTAGIIILKTLFASFAGILVGLPLRAALLSGMAVSQIGEFSFVLAKNGADLSIINPENYQLFLALALTSMGITPSLIYNSSWIADLIARLPIPYQIKAGLFSLPQDQSEKTLENHVVIIGYGVCGKNLAHACMEADVPYIVIEMNSETVLKEKRKGIPISYGDAAHPAVLTHANVQNAKSIAILINETQACLRIVEQVRLLNPHIFIITRLKYIAHRDSLIRAGSSEVVVDEIESAFEIFSKMMTILEIPIAKIQKIVSDMQFEILDSSRLQSTSLLIDYELGIKNFKVPKEHFLVNKNLSELDLKERFGLNILMIKREDQVISNINGKTLIQEDDLLVLTGSKNRINDDLTKLLAS